jgi:hypothetical protein
MSNKKINTVLGVINMICRTAEKLPIGSSEKKEFVEHLFLGRVERLLSENKISKELAEECRKNEGLSSIIDGVIEIWHQQKSSIFKKLLSCFK